MRLIRSRKGRLECQSPACLSVEKTFEITNSSDLVEADSGLCSCNERAEVRNTRQLDIKDFGKRRPLLEGEENNGLQGRDYSKIFGPLKKMRRDTKTFECGVRSDARMKIGPICARVG